MIRERLQNALKQSLRSGDNVERSALRLIIAAIKDRDIEKRTQNKVSGISDDEIISLLQTMIKQRRESAEIYRKAEREELAAQEEKEIAIINGFLPEQMDEKAIEQVVIKTISSFGASSLKDMGAIMVELRKNYSGVMDFGKAGQYAKQKLSR